MKRQITPTLLLALLLPLQFHNSARVSAQPSPSKSAEQTTLYVAGLKGSVTVRRDARGIPYIEAKDDADLYFAQGYVTASDRLFQMELFRRTARGELAEIFGAAPDGSVLESDKQHRRYGFTQLAEAQAARLPARLKSALESYARGVNAYIESLAPKALPPEFLLLQLRPRPWTPADSLIIGKLFDENLSSSWRLDLTRAAFADLPREMQDQLFPETSPLDVILFGSDRQKKANVPTDLPQPPNAVTTEELDAVAADEAVARSALERIGLYSKDCSASNNWVVSGKLTATGKPMLANDPHLSSSAPSIWYMAHLSTPGHRAAGVSVAGLPGIAIGHNEKIAWGVTSLEPDVQDLYMEKFDPADPRRYSTPSGWREAVVRTEEIKVRKSPIGTATDTVSLEVTVTRHGPIVLEVHNVGYALRWTALDPDTNLAESFYLLNTARDWDDFRAALRNYSGPAFNMIYADTKGHIGYQGTGRFPIRKTGEGKLPYDGSTDEGEWTGFIPYDALPRVYDPADGIILTANNRIVGLDYPYKLTVVPDPAYRAHRISDLLHSRKKFTIDDFRAIQGDTYTHAGVLFARELAEVAREDTTTNAKDEKWLATLRLLEAWDGKVSPDSRAALMASHIRQSFRRRVLAAAVGAERARRYSYSNADTLIDRLIQERPAAWLPKEFKSYAELLHACVDEARGELSKEYGVDEMKWTWGREFQVRFPHPLANIPMVGQPFLVQPFPQNGGTNRFPTVNRGSAVSMRLIADLSDWDRTRQGIALGVSGRPDSPHWQDQLDDWRNVTPAALPFTKAAVAAAAKETVILEPADK